MKPRKIPMRMCVGCREMKPKKALLRVVRTPEGEVAFDTTGKLSGRGAYVCPSEGCLERAIKQKQLDRALEHSLSPEVVEALREKLRGMPPLTGEDTP